MELPDGEEIEALDLGALPGWAASRRSLALAVPSAVLPEEQNHLLNPAHQSFTKVVTRKPAALVLDPRLLAKKR